MILYFLFLFVVVVVVVVVVVAEVFEKGLGGQEELTKSMAKTMSSSYLEEDYLHRINDTESDGPNFLCRIVPSVAPNQTLNKT